MSTKKYGRENTASYLRFNLGKYLENHRHTTRPGQEPAPPSGAGYFGTARYVPTAPAQAAGERSSDIPPTHQEQRPQQHQAAPGPARPRAAQRPRHTTGKPTHQVQQPQPGAEDQGTEAHTANTPGAASDAAPSRKNQPHQDPAPAPWDPHTVCPRTTTTKDQAPNQLRRNPTTPTPNCPRIYIAK